MRLFGLLFAVIATITVTVVGADEETQKSESSSPLFGLVLCPFRAEPYSCVRQQASRMLKELGDVVARKSDEFKAEADAEIATKMQSRGFSMSESDPRQRPSFVMQTVEDTLDTITDSVEELVVERGDDEEEKKDQKDKKDKDKKKKMKMKKKKKKPQGGEHEYEEDDHEVIEWEEVDELEDVQVGGHGGGMKMKHKHGQETGRDIGEKRGKKKKKKKAIMKLLLLGAVLKGKVELLLKLISAHLQMKFFAIAVLGLLINLARFWVDVKKGHQPQKVIYYEHAQHQHHYDDHGDEGWSGGGGYWKRSFDAPDKAAATEENGGTYYSTDHHNNPNPSAATNIYESSANGFELGVNRQPYQVNAAGYDHHQAQQLAYSKQVPQQAARY